MKAITVKYIGPSNTRGSRIKASDNDGHSITIGYDHGANDGGRKEAVTKLCQKMSWNGRWIGGTIAGKGIDVYVCDPETWNTSLAVVD